jgi:hypothetical protein
MILRGHPGGIMSATAGLVVATGWNVMVQGVGTGDLPLMKALRSKEASSTLVFHYYLNW